VFTVAVRQIIDNTDAERQQRNTKLQVEMPSRTTINNTQNSAVRGQFQLTLPDTV